MIKINDKAINKLQKEINNVDGDNNLVKVNDFCRNHKLTKLNYLVHDLYKARVTTFPIQSLNSNTSKAIWKIHFYFTVFKEAENYYR